MTTLLLLQNQYCKYSRDFTPHSAYTQWQLLQQTPNWENFRQRSAHISFASSACLSHISAQSQLFKTTSCDWTTHSVQLKDNTSNSNQTDLTKLGLEYDDDWSPLSWLSDNPPGCIVFICPVQLNWSNCSRAQWLIIISRKLQWTWSVPALHWSALGPPSHNNELPA